jgi:hypothetical protein
MKNTIKFLWIIALFAVFGFSFSSCDILNVGNTTVKLTNLSGETLTVTEIKLDFVGDVLWSGAEEIADGETKKLTFMWEKDDWGHPIVEIIRENGDIEYVGGGLSLTITGGMTNTLYIKWVGYVSWLRLGDSDDDAIRRN